MTLSRLIVLLTLGALAFPATAPAARNGKIAFESDHAGSFDIWSVWPSGKGRKQLTTGKAQESDPAYSPDGRRIAYVRGEHVWLMRADGRHQRVVTRRVSDVRDVSWSPDGRRIMFSDNSHGVDIFTVAPSGRHLTRLTHTPNQTEIQAVYGPGGRSIVFLHGSRNEVYRLFTMNPDGSYPHQLFYGRGAGSEQPAFSPDGTYLVTIRDSAIWLSYANGAGRHRIGYGWAPVWSPDGTRIAFSDQDDDQTRSTVYAKAPAAGTRFEKISPWPRSDYADAATWQPR